jgi:hypothetical protein
LPFGCQLRPQLSLWPTRFPLVSNRSFANLIGLAQRRAEKNDLKTANFLYELAGYDPVEEGGAAAKQKKPDLKIIVDNTKP